VLAAGGSTRLGEPKQLLTLVENETLVHWAVRAAREGGCESVCVVSGEDHSRIAKAVTDLDPVIVHNAEWSRGIGSSIRAGVNELTRENISAIILLTCDQPALDAAIIRALIKRHEESGCAIVASHYAGTLGIPALFSLDCYDDLRRLPDDRGAKELIASRKTSVAQIEFPAGAFDLDSPADLEAWRTRCSSSPGA
jgi:molybdenum cofactor cytidylyltransferase